MSTDVVERPSANVNLFQFNERDEWPHPEFRTDDPAWQESLLLHWYDRNTGFGGFHRIGHEVNKKRAPIWNLLISRDDGWRYLRRSDEPLTEADQFPTGFGAGPSLRYVYEDGLSKWFVKDGPVEAEIHCNNFFPIISSIPTDADDFLQTVAKAHFECAGRVTGWVSYNGKRTEIEGLGYRDHSWGPRYWEEDDILLAERWFTGTFGPELSYQACSCLLPDGTLCRYGFVVRNGKVTYADNFDIVVHMEEDGFTHRGGEITFSLPGEEPLRIRCKAVGGGALFRHGNLFVVEELVESESSTGLKGSGCCEMVNNAQRGRDDVKFAINVGLENGISTFKPIRW